MSRAASRSGPRTITVIVLVVLAIAAFVVIRRWNHVRIVPQPPEAAVVKIAPLTTTSYASVPVSISLDRIRQEIENALDANFIGEVSNVIGELADDRVYWNLNRDAIQVTSATEAGRLIATSGISGKVQLEFKVKLPLIGTVASPSVGAEVRGSLNASVAPTFGTQWNVEPHVELGGSLDSVVVDTPLGDLDLAPHFRGPFIEAVRGQTSNAKNQLVGALELRRKVEDFWRKINTVVNVSADPPTWIQLAPESAQLSAFQYNRSSIDASLAISMATRVLFRRNHLPSSSLRFPTSTSQMNCRLASMLLCLLKSPMTP